MCFGLTEVVGFYYSNNNIVFVIFIYNTSTFCIKMKVSIVLIYQGFSFKFLLCSHLLQFESFHHWRKADTGQNMF